MNAPISPTLLMATADWGENPKSRSAGTATMPPPPTVAPKKPATSPTAKMLISCITDPSLSWVPEKSDFCRGGRIRTPDTGFWSLWLLSRYLTTANALTGLPSPSVIFRGTPKNSNLSGSSSVLESLSKSTASCLRRNFSTDSSASLLNPTNLGLKGKICFAISMVNASRNTTPVSGPTATPGL